MSNEMTLPVLVSEKARTQPDFVVLTFECNGAEETRTYSQLWENALRIALALRERGVKPGDRFAILMQNHPEFVESMVAAGSSGCRSRCRLIPGQKVRNWRTCFATQGARVSSVATMGSLRCRWPAPVRRLCLGPMSWAMTVQLRAKNSTSENSARYTHCQSLTCLSSPKVWVI